MQQSELADTPTDAVDGSMPGTGMPAAGDANATATGGTGTAAPGPESATADMSGTPTRRVSNTFVCIKDVRSLSRARSLRLQEGDVIAAIDGKPFYEDIETFLDVLFENEDEAGLVLTVYRKGVMFNVITKGPLGATLEYAKPEMADLVRAAFETFTVEPKETIIVFEVLRNMERSCRIIDTRLSPLAYLAPPVWVVYNRLWEVLVALVMIYVVTLAVHWVLFLIALVLLGMYFKRAHLVLRRSFALVRGYHMWMVIAAKSELEVQKICRQIDEKSTFEMDLLGPTESEEKPKKRRRRSQTTAAEQAGTERA